MPNDFIRIEIVGLDRILASLNAMTKEFRQYFNAAGKEAASEIMNTEGLKKYPPTGPNPAQPFKTDKQRRWFFAALRRGDIEVPYRRGGKRSEKYGAQWYYKNEGLNTHIGNRASYAPYLAGGGSKYMARLGWRKLIDVVNEKAGAINRIYNAWMQKLIRDKGL